MAKLTKQELATLAEARAAVSRLNDSLNAAPHNRYGEFGRNTYAAIDRWKATIARLEAKQAS